MVPFMCVVVSQLFLPVRDYLDCRATEFDQIPDDRKHQLKRLSNYVSECCQQSVPSKLIFVCTHNSRRSHLAQTWAQISADYFSIPNVESYSGGTEATEINSRIVAAFQRAGLVVEQLKPEPNASQTKYQGSYSQQASPLLYFSKHYAEQPNPRTGFAAVMVCNEADSACPAVAGATVRLALPYIDPKIADGTDEESATYDLRCRQIAREMLFTMQQVQNSN